jgi:hypothetical protein
VLSCNVCCGAVRNFCSGQFVPRHTICTATHNLYRDAQFVRRRTICTATHNLYRDTQFVPRHTICTATHLSRITFQTEAQTQLRVYELRILLLFDFNRNPKERTIKPSHKSVKCLSSCFLQADEALHTFSLRGFLSGLYCRCKLCQDVSNSSTASSCPVLMAVERELLLFLTPALGTVEWTDSLSIRSTPG